MKCVWVASAVLLLSTGLAAQGKSNNSNNSNNGNNPKPQSAIGVHVSGLSCTTPAGTDAFSVLAWSWGASNSGDFTSGGGGGAGKVNIQDVSLTKPFDACSPDLLGAVATGKHYQSLTLTQSNSDGTVTTLALSDVIVSSWSAGGSVNSEAASENVTFGFAKVCLTDGGSGSKFCYDLKANKTF